ncbi:IS5/IS1182 family transposase, partial [Lactobacillus crispatus]
NKYCQRRWLKGRFLLLKILKRTKKRSRFLKKEILIVFIHLEASFFPDTSMLKFVMYWLTITKVGFTMTGR